MTPECPDEYLTIKATVRSKTKVEGSIFIATAVPVESEKSLPDWIEKISSEFFDATHNCYAARIRAEQEERSRFSDAGEPRGTAGRPILSAIQGENLYDVLVVVTRYFGGVKLGTGRLSRAYRDSAQSALQMAEKVTKLLSSELSLSYPSSMMGKVSQVFSRFRISVLDQGFDKQATARILVRASRLDSVKKALIQNTNGQVKFE
jgi:uncharacterized YigZ family protein